MPVTPAVIAIFGPTGVGKTAVAVELAELLRAQGEDPVAISADALQVYAGLGALTGAASADEQERLEHRLIGFLAVNWTFSAGEFAGLAHVEIDSARAYGRRPLVVGGTGLYLRAALADLRLAPPPPPELRARLQAAVDARGPQELHAELAQRAPAVAERIEPADRSRIVRALELAEMGRLEEPEDENELWTEDVRVPTLLFGLTMEREQLYRKIDERVEAIVEAGAAEEVRAAEAAGASATARKALGYEELLRGDVEGLKRRTRNYAKRQLSWMRKLSSVRAIDVTGRTARSTGEEIAQIARAG